MEPELTPPASTAVQASSPLQRSTSQLSTASARSSRGHSVRAKSRSRKLNTQPSSSASSIAASDKSLTSFPSFSPESPQNEPSVSPGTYREAVTSARKSPNSNLHTATAASIVDSLTSASATAADQPKTARSALFDDTPLTARRIPGALHHADDDHIQRLVARHGAVTLVRQIAEDLAQRDNEIAALRRRTDARERALRKIILECGLSNLDLETRLRNVEAEVKSQERANHGRDGGLSDMMNDAMHDSMSHSQTGLGIGNIDDATIRAGASSPVPKNTNTGKGTMKAWKEYLWGNSTSKKTSREASRANSINGDGPSRTAIRAPTQGDRRPVIQEDQFVPPDVESLPSSSRASSIYSGHAPKKPSASLASMALQLVAGKASTNRDTDSLRGRASSAGYGASVRTSSNTSTRSNRAASTQGGPKALMAMRRSGTPSQTTRTQPHERWEGMSASPPDSAIARPDNYGPVEMDTIFSPEGQPPTLTHIYNNYNGSEYLTDRFGFIYDQRRKKRQREAAQVALRTKGGSRAEMLSGARSSLSPNLFDDEASARETDSIDQPGTPSSTEELIDQARPKRWQDYLKIATFPTELLSHTPSITATNIQVLEGTDVPKSPSLITSDDRGFVPPASTTAALDSEAAPKSHEETSATLVYEDAEPVKLLLKQLSDVHDALQREKTVRWNEFLRKVRAERRRESEAAVAAASAAAEARFQKAPVMIPEAKLPDGETIGVADLGVKGKVGRAKWNEFRHLVLGGIPVANRPKIWAECSGSLSKRVPGYYADLVSRPSDDDDPAVISQIDMDINRTLTDNIYFRRGPGVHKLSEVLRAYARRNPEVGYCQGMNLITANLLLIMPSAEDTFWVLCSIIEHILPQGYYDHSLLASRADQQVLRQYVTQVLPKLSQHLEDLSIELEALTFQWFLSVFTDCLSAEALFRVWDVVLCINDGSTFLFQVALALLKLNEQQLLQCDTPAAIYTYINHQMTNHAISIDGLINASEGLRKVVRRDEVENRRQKAIDLDKQLMRERETRNQLRRTQKALSAPALVSETTASALPSPMPSPALRGENGSVVGLGSGSSAEDILRSRTPVEEETTLGLG
ncbi:hypothetical protein SLS62_004199 [Diatrype stigma]|uniref:Rab-GAP TBC domain-containing protein n=1 Tax=Diatrype stigma TaxID=117547 RepID=A0AAN9V5E0_9PEZI